MKYLRDFFVSTLVGGVLVIVPIYLAVLLVAKGMQTVAGLVKPIARLVPDWLPAQGLLSLLLVLAVCFVVGALIRTSLGRKLLEKIEKSFFERLPGYASFRSLTHRLTGTSDQNEWQPALAEVEDALVPAFIVEELDDGRYTVFIPSIPTPLAGAVYILARERVHPVDVPFAQAVRTISQWGSGSKELAAAMARATAAR
jgi:uncharacterized membrane protein